MSEQAVLQQEIADSEKAIARLQDEVKAIQGFIAADERNVHHSVEAIRVNAQQSLNNYRNSLAQKQTELQYLQQEQLRRKAILAKMQEIGRKEQEAQHLEREKERIINLHERARTDLERLKEELAVMYRPPEIPACELIMADGQRIPLPTHETDLLVGCKDPADGIFPAIDLTPFGGTASGVSRRHATISFRNGQWTISDENSTNGTFVDEARIAPYVPRVISDGARLRFGTVVATFARRVPTAGKTRRLG